MEHAVWNPQAECMDREALEQLQLERLQMTLNLAARNVDFYAKKFRDLGLLPEDIKCLSDLAQIPCTTRDDLIRAYPYGMFAVPLRSVVQLRFAAANAEPIVVGYTRQDIRMWTELMCRAMTAAGIGRTDIIQVAFHYSQFPGAFTFNQGAEALGAMFTPAATVSAALQIRMMTDFRSTALASTPSFGLNMLPALAQAEQKNDLHLRIGLFGPEALTPVVRERLERGLGLKAYALYGVAEMIEPALAAECVQQRGLHLAEDHFLVEIVDPKTGAVQAPGEEGEVVVTSMSTQGYPVIRLRTGDMSRLLPGPCPCGRTLAKLSPITRRCDDALVVRGVRFFPQSLERIVRDVAPDIEDFRVVVHTMHGLGDQVELLVSPAQGASLPGAVLETLRSRVRRALGLGLRLRQVPAQRLPLSGLTYKTTILEQESAGADLMF